MKNRMFQAVGGIAMAVALTMPSRQAAADLPSGAFAGRYFTAVTVDTSACRTGLVQCSGTATTDAVAGGVVPVAVTLQVSDSSGVPVLSLTSASFTIATKFVPAGGSLLQLRSCASCFQDSGNGVYRFFVEPLKGQTWRAGTYVVQVRTPGTYAISEVKIAF